MFLFQLQSSLPRARELARSCARFPTISRQTEPTELVLTKKTSIFVAKGSRERAVEPFAKIGYDKTIKIKHDSVYRIRLRVN